MWISTECQHFTVSETDATYLLNRSAGKAKLSSLESQGFSGSTEVVLLAS